jgi:hypothetical protein
MSEARTDNDGNTVLKRLAIRPYVQPLVALMYAYIVLDLLGHHQNLCHLPI